jgi:hypothetical protein
MQLMGIGGDVNAANYGEYAKKFGTDQFEQDPGYEFRREEGMRGLDRSASARGGVLSGSALKNIQRFGQDLASQEYQNAFNRYQTERAARLNTLGGLSDSGQAASNVMTGAAGAYGSNSAANALARAQATSGISIGRGNARAGVAMNRGAVTSSNALNLGEATAGIGLARGNTAATNALNRGAATKANDAAYYGNVSNLTLARGQNTANNAFYVSDAAQRGAANIGNAASQSAYNIGNAQAGGAMNVGAARASGYVGSANAYNNALGQVAGYATQAPMNNAIMQYYKRRVPGSGGYIPLSDDG